jgi:hypothetical protein
MKSGMNDAPKSSTIGLATKPTSATQQLFGAVCSYDVSNLLFSSALSAVVGFSRYRQQDHDGGWVSTLVPVPQCLLVPSHVALLLLQDAIHYALDDARCGHVPAGLHARVAHSPGCDVVCSSLPPSGAKAPKWFPCSKGTPLRGACEGLQGLYLSTDVRRCADCASQDPGLQLHANAPDRDHFSLVST